VKNEPVILYIPGWCGRVEVIDDEANDVDEKKCQR